MPQPPSPFLAFPLALAGIAIAAAAAILAVLMARGAFSGGSGCGDFGLGCLGQGIVLLGAGCAIGLIVSIASLRTSSGHTWLGWLGVAINGVPVMAIIVGALVIAVRRG